MEEKKKGTPLPGTSFGPETITNILKTLATFKSSKGHTLASLAQSTESKNANVILLPLEEIVETCEAANFRKETLIKYLLAQDKLIVQHAEDLNFWTNYTGLVQYPNLYKKAYLIANPRLVQEGIIFDIDEPLLVKMHLGVMAIAITDEKLTRRPEEESPFAGCIVKLYVVHDSEKNSKMQEDLNDGTDN